MAFTIQHDAKEKISNDTLEGCRIKSRQNGRRSARKECTKDVRIPVSSYVTSPHGLNSGFSESTGTAAVFEKATQILPTAFLGRTCLKVMLREEDVESGPFSVDLTETFGRKFHIRGFDDLPADMLQRPCKNALNHSDNNIHNSHFRKNHSKLQHL